MSKDTTRKLTPVTKDFLRLFLFPFMKALEAPRLFEQINRCAELFFHIDERQIDQYTVNTAFTMPGRYGITFSLARPNKGPRSVKRGEYILVRRDITIKNRVDLQLIRDQDNQDHMYYLSDQQWEYIKGNLDVR